MSYQVLARKWRPQRFSELVGQEHVVSAISNALDNNRLHHAYLFTGTRGVGKTTIARIFAKSLNCEEGQSANPCGKCGTCVDIEQGRFVDLLEIDAASRTKVEDTRELLDNVQYRPTRGDYKVYLIDEVHMLSKHSFNALLKTLEEPPPHVKFLLATTDPQKLPITILSRCLQFNLKALSREQISQQLSTVLTQESIAFESPALSLLARAAQGSMRDALSLTDQAIAQGDNHVTQSVVAAMLGLLDRNHILRIAQALATKDAPQVLDLIDELSTQAPDFSQVLNELNATLHQVALTQIVPDACKLETTHAKAIYQLAKTFTPEHVQLLYQIGVDGLRTLQHAPEPRVGVEMILMRMLAFSPAAQLENVESIIQQPPSAPPLAEPQPSVEAVAAPQPAEMAPQLEEIPPQPEEFPPQANLDDFSVSMPEPVEQELVALEQEQSDIQQQAEQMRAPHQQDESGEDPNLARTKAMLALQQRMANTGQQEASDAGKKSESDIDSGPKSTPSLENESAPVLAQAIDEAQDSTVVDFDATGSEEQADQMPPWDEAPKQPESVQEIPVTDPETPTPSSEPSSVSVQPQTIQPVLDSGEKLVSANQIDQWAAIIESMQVVGLVKQVALHSSFSQQNDAINLILDAQQQHLLNDTITSQLASVLSAHFARDITLNIDIGEPQNTPFEVQQNIDSMRLQHAKSVVQSNEAIGQLMTTFNGRVLDDSIKPQ